jgi:hypothetical protein
MYITTSNLCQAHISVNKNRVKIYSNLNGLADHTNSVFLKDGQNFEIELYNPKTTTVLAKISINGRDISSSGIVLRPGQRVFIERFIDEPKKFAFSTYEVENTSQNRAAIANNGEVEVRFYDEWALSGTTSNYWINSNPTYTYTTNGNVGIGTTSPNSTFTVGGTSTAFYSNSNATLTSSFSNIKSPIAGSLETGIVEKGGNSSQSFSNYAGNFNSWPCNTETIKLLPVSQKPVETSEIRNYCTNCGTRAKKSGWKFCPSCGNRF